MPNKKDRGSALLLTTILLFVILSMVVSLTYVTVMEQKMSSKTKSSVGSFYSAESGVEWVLNKIANATESTIQGAFGGASRFNADKSVKCPDSFGVDICKVYFLDQDGKVITNLSLEPSEIKAVRSVGTQGNETTRAIEAAVAAGVSGCYISYGAPPGPADPTGKCLQGFTNMGSAGQWGNCHDTSGFYGVQHDGFFRPPGGGCEGGSGVGWVSYNVGEAFVCCK